VRDALHLSPLSARSRDLKTAERTLSLPYWMAKKHPEFMNLINIEEARGEKRSLML